MKILTQQVVPMTRRVTRAHPAWWDGMEPLWPGLAGSLLEELFAEPSRGVREFAPAVDGSETETEYVLSAELPGTSREDLTLEVHDGTLTLRGEKRSEKEGDDQHARWTERRFGSFHRTFRVPPDADAKGVAADFKDGVLTIRLPKREETRARTVPIGLAGEKA